MNRQNRHNQTIYRKKFKLIKDTNQLASLVRAYNFISVVDKKTVAENYNKTQKFPAILLSNIFDAQVVNGYLVILDKSTQTGFVLRPNFLVAEITKNNLVLICNDYHELLLQ